MANPAQMQVTDLGKVSVTPVQADAQSGDSGASLTIDQLLQQAQDEQAKLVKERMAAEAQATRQKKTEQDRAAAVKDLQGKMGDIDKLIGDYEKAFVANKAKVDALNARCTTMLNNIRNSVAAPDIKAIDDVLEASKQALETLRHSIDDLESPVAVPNPDQEPKSIADAAVRVQAATAEQQKKDQLYKDLLQKVKTVDTKLKDLGTQADTLQTALDADPKDRINYFRVKELEKGLAELPELLEPKAQKQKLSAGADRVSQCAARTFGRAIEAE